MDYKDVYWVQINDPPPVWRKLGTHWTGRWDVTSSFSGVEDAKAGLKEWLSAHRYNRTFSFRIIGASGTVYATYQNGEWYNPAERGATIVMGTINLPINLEKPLNLTRSKVIAKLQANLKKEQEDRAAAEKKEADARNDFRQFVLDHEDQIVNYLRSCVSSSTHTWGHALEKAEETFKDDAFASKESKPGRLESELEKFVRVLEMSGDETVEVTPTKELYDLL